MTDKIDTSPAAIAAILEGVTPGPWKWNVGAPRKSIDDILGYSVIEAEEYAGACWIDVRHQDAAFIAAARDLVPALAAERDRLVAQLAEARAEGWRRGIEAAAEVCTAVIRDYRVVKKDGVTYEIARVQPVAHGLVSVAREEIRALSLPADLGAPA